MFSNKFSQKKTTKNAISDIKVNKSINKNNKLKYYESVTVRLSDELRIKADGVVLFPHEFVGNTVIIIIVRNGLKMENIQILTIQILKG